MLYNIQYVYGKNNEGKKELVGAKVLGFDGNKTYIQEIYVGLRLTLEDVLENEVNAMSIGVKNTSILKDKFESLKAAGIIYFPQVDCYEFLEEGDVVIPWINEELVASSLDAALQPYKNKATDEVVKSKMAAKKAYVESLDPENPLIELNGLFVRKHKSSR